MPIFILFAGMLGLMLMRVYLPIGQPAKGKTLKVVYLSFPERALLHRMNMYAIGAVLMLTAVTGLLPTTWELLIVLLSFGIVLMPVRYIITSEGIGMNSVVFRPWSELSRFTTERRRIHIEGSDGARPFNLALLAGNQQEVLPLLRRFLAPAGRRREAARVPVRAG